MPLLSLNRLRKGVVFSVFLLFFFILYRSFFFKTNQDSISPEDNLKAYTEICLLVTNAGPVNIDTVFNLKSGINKIFAYSFLETGFNISDTVWHIWHYGSEMVKSTACTIENNACFSSISADSLRKGSWSVDTRQGNILFDIKQFSIENF